MDELTVDGNKAVIENCVSLMKSDIQEMDDAQCEALNTIFEKTFARSSSFHYRKDDRYSNRVNMLNILDFVRERCSGNYDLVVILNNLLWACRAIKEYHRILERDGLGEMVVL